MKLLNIIFGIFAFSVFAAPENPEGFKKVANSHSHFQQYQRYTNDGIAQTFDSQGRLSYWRLPADGTVIVNSHAFDSESKEFKMAKNSVSYQVRKNNGIVQTFDSQGWLLYWTLPDGTVIVNSHAFDSESEQLKMLKMAENSHSDNAYYRRNTDDGIVKTFNSQGQLLYWVLPDGTVIVNSRLD